jgi:hypothetical protein
MELVSYTKKPLYITVLFDFAHVKVLNIRLLRIQICCCNVNLTADIALHTVNNYVSCISLDIEMSENI